MGKVHDFFEDVDTTTAEDDVEDNSESEEHFEPIKTKRAGLNGASNSNNDKNEDSDEESVG